MQSFWLNSLGKFNTLEMIHYYQQKERIPLLESIGKNGLNFIHPAPSLRKLALLLEIEEKPSISQSALAKRVGLAPSMVNNYIKEFIDEGLIEMRGTSHRKTTYHLSKKGVAERSRLLFSYMIETIKLYKSAKEELKNKLLNFQKDGIRKVVFYGAGDTCEIALNAAREVGFEIVGIVDSDIAKQGENFGGLLIEPPSKIEELRPDGVIITSISHREEIRKNISFLEKANIIIKEL